MKNTDVLPLIHSKKKLVFIQKYKHFDELFFRKHWQSMNP